MPKIFIKKDSNIIVANVWVYRLNSGYEIFAGKTEEDNDLLSLKVADPWDWWFHVSGLPGSHVILRVNDGNSDSVDKKSLCQAAAIAAYHSKARGVSGLVHVSGTLAKNVIKKSNFKAGTVRICKETIFRTKPFLPFI